MFKGEGVKDGDCDFVYSGSKQGDESGFTARRTIKRWRPSSESAFGGMDQFEIEFRASATPSRFAAKGSIVGRPGVTLTAEGCYLVTAA